MKKPIALLAATIALSLASVQASARPIHGTLMQAELTQLYVDPSLSAAQNAVSGVVRHDLGENTLELILLRKNICRPGFYCAAVMDPNFEVKLSIVSEHTTDCGSRKIVAVEDRTPVDGQRQSLVLMDHTGNHCRTRIALPSTQVTYDTAGHFRMTGEQVETHSTFSGNALHLMRIRN